MTSAADTPSLDLDAGRLRLSARHLGTLADLASQDGAPPDPELLATLTAAGVLAPDGEVVPRLRPLAAAAATGQTVVRVSRLRGDLLREVQVRAGPDGVLVAPVADDGVGEVALQEPTALARTLWRLSHLGPRTTRPTATATTTPDALVAGVREGTGRWREELGVTDATLTRLEARTAPEGPVAGLLLLDAPEGCWWAVGEGARVRLVPATPLEVLDVLAGWQRATSGPGVAGVDEDPDEATPVSVVVGEGEVHVPVPASWTLLDDDPALPLVAHQAPTGTFAVNVTVVPTGPPPSGEDAAARLAEELPGARVIGARSSRDGTIAVVVHAGPTEDLLAVQRLVPVGRAGAAATYTCSVGQWPAWGARLQELAGQVGT
jgi:hypothetical protein